MPDNVAQVEDYIVELFGCSDEALVAALRACEEAGLPNIQVDPMQGKYLSLLANMLGARHILEIGTLGGYSTIWLARGMAPGGQIVTLELEPLRAEVARRNLERAGVQDAVQIVVGSALESLPKVAENLSAQFDLVFIDADKESYPEYLQWAVRLTRPGALILADNVVRDGAVLDPDPEDTATVGARQFNADLAAHPQLDSVILPQIGTKGYDGIAIAVVKR